MQYERGGMMRNVVGFHLGNEGPITNIDWEILRLLPPVAVTWLPNYGWHSQPISHRRGADQDKRCDVERILEISPGCHFIPRPYVSPGRFGDREHPNYDFIPAWLEVLKRLMDELAEEIPEGQRHLHPFNEQNMPRFSQWEGFGTRESDIKKFNEVFLFCYEVLKAHNPTFKIGWSPLTPGNFDVHFTGDVEHRHYYMHGPEAAVNDLALKGVRRNAAIVSGLCYESLMKADEYYAHVYVRPQFGLTAREVVFMMWGGQRYVELAEYFPKPMDVWITECGVTTDGTTIAVPALLDWVELLSNDPMVKGVTFWILGTHWHGLWYKDGKPHPAVYALKEMLKDAEESPGDFIKRLMALAESSVIPMVPGHALFDAIEADDRMPCSREGRGELDGVRYAWQWGFDSAQNTRWLYACEEGDWGNILKGERPN